VGWVMASGADFTFMGRSFMYSVAALGDKGGDHIIAMLKTQLQQVMEQVCCEHIRDLPQHLIKEGHIAQLHKGS
jgi:L-lactate dehydrogenase (cytochrome)